MSFYTYAHYTKDDNQLFYIGKGSFSKQGLFKRAYAKIGRNAYWQNKTKKHDGFTVQILAVWATEQEAFEHEQFLISCFKGKLVNLTLGGEGCYGRKQSQEEKDKRAASNRGKKRTEECVKRMSEAQKKNQAALNSLKAIQEKQKKKVVCVSTGIVYESLAEASRKTSINIQNISRVCLGQRSHTKGLKWEFVK